MAPGQTFPADDGAGWLGRCPDQGGGGGGDGTGGELELRMLGVEAYPPQGRWVVP